MRLRVPIAILALALAAPGTGCGGGHGSAGSSATTAATGTAAEQTNATTTAGESTADTTPEQTTVPEQGAGNVGSQRNPAEDEATIKETLASVLLVSADPAEICGRLVTAAYVKRSYGNEQGCRAAQAEQSAPETVKIGEIDVRGTRASTVVEFEGGTYAGEKGRVQLALEHGTWKLDALRVNAPPGP